MARRVTAAPGAMPAIISGVAIALLTNHLVPYRIPLYERLAAEYGVEVLCYGGGERYMPGEGAPSSTPSSSRRRFRPPRWTAGGSVCRRTPL